MTCLSAVLVGMLCGFVTAFCVSQSLLEISSSEFFANAIGIFLLLLGSLLIWRVQHEQWNGTPGASAQRCVVLSLGTLVLMSGTFCFILEKSWMLKLGPTEKTPMYICLAVALSFAIIFSLVELINFCYALRVASKENNMGNRGGEDGFDGHYYDNRGGDGSNVAPIIGTTHQIYINLFACIFCGSYFGIMFSFLGLEDNGTDHILIHKERLYTFPMGIMCGAMVGAANYMSAIQAATYDRKF
jgi:hypothetical protein